MLTLRHKLDIASDRIIWITRFFRSASKLLPERSFGILSPSIAIGVRRKTYSNWLLVGLVLLPWPVSLSPDFLGCLLAVAGSLNPSASPPCPSRPRCIPQRRCIFYSSNRHPAFMIVQLPKRQVECASQRDGKISSGSGLGAEDQFGGRARNCVKSGMCLLQSTFQSICRGCDP